MNALALLDRGRSPVAGAPAARRLGPRGRAVAARLGLVVALAAAMALHANASAATVALVGLLTVPGDWLRRALRVEASTATVRVVLAVAGSIAVLLAVCLAVQGVGRLCGVHRPLDRGPLTIGTVLALSVLAVLPPPRERLPEPAAPDARSGRVIAGLMLLPVLSAAGTQLLDAGRGPWAVLAGIVLSAAAVATATVSPRFPEAVRPWTLYACALAVLWSFSMRTTYVYGYDIHRELQVALRTASVGAWHSAAGDPYSAMLSITALPAALATVSGVPVLWLYKAVYPALFALFPAATYTLARRWVPARTALAATVLVGFVPASLWQIPAIARQEIGLVVFAALVLVPFAARGPRWASTALGSVLALALVVSHYSSSYVAAAVIGGGVALGALLRGRAVRTARVTMPPLVVVVLVLGALVWNAGITDSTSNVTATATAVSRNGPGIRDDHRSPIISWLASTTTTPVTAERAFALAAATNDARPWLQPYDSASLKDFSAADDASPRPHALVPGSALPLLVAYSVLRQGVNGALVLGAALLSLVVLRRRRNLLRDQAAGARRPAIRADLAALSVSALATAAVMRTDTSLSLAYNPERLALQTSLITVVPLCLLLQWLQRRTVLRQAGAWLAAVLVVAGLLDVSGLRALVAGDDVGNLRAGGEYYERYAVTQSDLAAAHWLWQHRTDRNLVYADRYGAMFLLGTTSARSGVIDLLAPATLDQRAWVFAGEGNLSTGRARILVGDAFSTYRFPRQFLESYKAVLYSNGAAEVY